MIQTICIYCASSTQIDPVYFGHARLLGRQLAEAHIRIVNGAGNIGLMGAVSDAAIALPGGYGTLEELLEIITWKQLGLYLNPIVILNTNGYYDPLLQLFRQAVDERFMRPLHADLWAVADTPEEAVRLAQTLPVWDQDIRRVAKY